MYIIYYQISLFILIIFLFKNIGTFVCAPIFLRLLKFKKLIYLIGTIHNKLNFFKYILFLDYLKFLSG